MELGKADRICGEADPGFSIWSSAHGLSHFRLTETAAWRKVWGAVLTLCLLALLGSVIIFSYQTFSSAVTSQVTMSPVTGPWPRTVVCDSQGLSSAAVRQARLSSRLVAFLTWSFHPSLVMESDHTIFRLTVEDGQRELADVLRFRKEYNGSFDSLLHSLMPRCEDVILECQLGLRPVLTGAACCQQIFSAQPHLTARGTCFITRPGLGSAREGLSLTTKHQQVEMDDDLGSPDLVAGAGAVLAVLGPGLSPAAGMVGRGVTVLPDTEAHIAVSPTTIDNTGRAASLIGFRSSIKCLHVLGRGRRIFNRFFDTFGGKSSQKVISFIAYYIYIMPGVSGPVWSLRTRWRII